MSGTGLVYVVSTQLFQFKAVWLRHFAEYPWYGYSCFIALTWDTRHNKYLAYKI
jgi:hypothetical protein